MLIYFITFFLSFFFIYIANKYKTKIPKFIYYILVLIGLIIPSLLAGFRALGVGTDTKGYINYTFYNCLNINSISELIQYIKTADIEPLYIVFDFIITRFTTSVNVSYFFIEFLILLFIYIACTKLKDTNKISFSYLLFLILFFNRSLNMCRQTIAISIMLISLKYIFERKLYKFLILFIIAFLFHKTAIVLLPFYFFYDLFNSPGKKALLGKMIFLTLFFIAIILYKQILMIFINAGILENKYLYYINNLTSNISSFDTTIKIITGLIILFFSNYMKKHENNCNYYIMNYIIGLFLLILGIYFGYGQRLAYYFEYQIIFLLPELVSICYKKVDKFFVAMLIIILSLFYSYVCYQVFGWDETVPYKSITQNK